jgi:hypothetical protein
MLRSLSFVKRASDKGEKVKSITLGLLPSPFGFTKELASMVCDSACRLGQAHTSNMLLFTYHFIFLHWHFVSPVTQLIQKFLKKTGSSFKSYLQRKPAILVTLDSAGGFERHQHREAEHHQCD